MKIRHIVNKISVAFLFVFVFLACFSCPVLAQNAKPASATEEVKELEKKEEETQQELQQKEKAIEEIKEEVQQVTEEKQKEEAEALLKQQEAKIAA